MHTLRNVSVTLLIVFGLGLQFTACAQDTRTVTRVVDGDTFVLDTGEKVRLLGIDTPEKWESAKLERDAERTRHDKRLIQALGQRASDFVKKLVEGKKVRLAADPLNSDRDKYGRLLRYVYLEDGTFINMKIVSEGYANAYTRFPLTKTEEFLAAQRDARENRRGLWSDDVFSSDGPAPTTAAPKETTATKSAAAPAQAENKNGETYWINSVNMTRHNTKCKYYGRTKRGYYTNKQEGRPCGLCGG